MKDAISIERVNSLHPLVRDDFKNFIEDSENSLNITIRISQGLRTFDEQRQLYAMGRTVPGKIVTNSKPGQSYHQYGLAVDLVELIDNGHSIDWGFDMEKLVPFANKYAIYWGGNFKKFKDRPHFEKTFGYSWNDLLTKYNTKDFIEGTQYVSL